MKRLLTLLLASVLFGCGENYDDSALTGRVDDLENRVAQLEELCKQMNTNISSLQTLVTALQNSDCITAVTPIENGYTITFKQAASPLRFTMEPTGKTVRTVRMDRMDRMEKTALTARTEKTALRLD